MNFWNTIWLLVSSFFFVAYLIVLFHIVVDLFRDPTLGGFAKAAWIVALVFLPMITALVYLVARGGGMAERQRALDAKGRSATEAYIRQVSSEQSPAEQIASAKRLLEDGTISQAEFARLKAHALA